MNAILNKIIRKELADSIPSDDLIERQRFALFRIYSFTSFLASFMTATQIMTAFSASSLLSWVLYGLSVVLLLNFYRVRDWQQLPVGYLISVVTGFAVVHIQAYTAGGVLNTGTIYMCVIIMTAFMLLGTKAGKWLTSLAVASIIFLYYASEYTGLTSYNLFNNDPALIREDALTTFILGVFLVAAQSNNLHSGKNVIIARITDQKNELERQNRKLEDYTHHLERTNKELDKFASIVSHDLKAPLRAIGNLTGWIEEDAGDTLAPEVRANFNLIKQRVRRMEDLINAILDYSRADRRQGDEEPIDSMALVRESFDFIGSPENAELVIRSEMPRFVSDKTRLVQVFTNLLGNAIKYNDKPQIRIEVSCRELADGWEFSVKDNGPGIDPKYHEKIFVIFQTLNRRDDVESTGVGLAIVKKIIEDQGGRIWVESDLGQGADFRFFWPKLRKQKDAALIAAAMVV
jgi:signal transduction histidine kinase